MHRERSRQMSSSSSSSCNNNGTNNPANPDLYFDMPDATPRFEFDLSPPSKRGNDSRRSRLASANTIRRSGFGTRKFGFGRGLGGGGGGRKLGAPVHGDDDGDHHGNDSHAHTPDRSCDHSKDGYGTSTTASTSVNSTSLDTGNSTDGIDGPLRLLSPMSSSSSQQRQHQQQQQQPSRGPTSIVSSASMDISEFSFDRVTVTTSETGTAYSVDWGFVDDAPVAAAIETTVHPATVDRGADPPSPRTMTTHGQGDESPSPPPPPRSSSFRSRGVGHDTALMLPDFDEMMARGPSEVYRCPSSSMYNVASCSQSVISEISERTGAFSLGGPVSLPDFASGEGTTNEGGRNVTSNDNGAPGGMTNSRTGSHPFVPSPSRRSCSSKSANNNDNGNNLNDPNKAKSPLPYLHSLLDDVRSNYALFKSMRGEESKKSRAAKNDDDDKFGPSSLLRWIVEDVEFCGWYLCGIDTTDVKVEDDDRAMAREARKKDTESAFLGKEIKVACGGNPFCVAL